MKTKTQKSTKAAKATAETNPKAEAPATAPEAGARKTPRLSDALKAEGDRIIAKRDKKAARAADPTPRERQEDLVVFAFRLTPAEREAIHQFAGPARASRFVRSLAVAAASRDAGAVARLLEGASSTTS